MIFCFIEIGWQHTQPRPISLIESLKIRIKTERSHKSPSITSQQSCEVMDGAVSSLLLIVATILPC